MAIGSARHSSGHVPQSGAFATTINQPYRTSPWLIIVASPAPIERFPVFLFSFRFSYSGDLNFRACPRIDLTPGRNSNKRRPWLE